jgi:hypothetical protein
MKSSKPCITPTKKQPVLQSLYVLPKAYYQSIISSPYVYRHNIYLVLAIVYLII